MSEQFLKDSQPRQGYMSTYFRPVGEDGPTPRTIITERINDNLARGINPWSAPSTLPTLQQSQLDGPTSYIFTHLDDPLSDKGLWELKSGALGTCIIDLWTTKKFELRTCLECNEERFLVSIADPSEYTTEVSEFPDFEQDYGYEFEDHGFCCARSVCKRCCERRFQENFYKDWWFHLDFAYWVRCPNKSCGKGMFPEVNDDEFKHYMQCIGYSEEQITEAMKLYRRLNLVRGFLHLHFYQREADPLKRDKMMKVSQWLHIHLVKAGLAYDVVDKRLLAKMNDTCKRWHWGITTSTFLETGATTTIAVPILAGMFVPAEEVQTCASCLEEYETPKFRTKAEFGKIWKTYVDKNKFDEGVGLSGLAGGTWRYDPEKALSFPINLADAHGHAADVCKACLKQHVATAVEDRKRLAVNSIQCPELGCTKILQPVDFGLHVPEKVYNDYMYYKRLTDAMEKPDFRHCSNPACRWWFVSRQNNANEKEKDKLICASCKKATCFKHDVPWHDGMTCDEYDAYKKREAEADAEELTRRAQTEQTIARVCKKCPKCGILIERMKWCYHITCKMCRYEFCWVCLAEWSAVYNAQENRHRPTNHNEGCIFRDGNFNPNMSPGHKGKDGTILGDIAGLDEQGRTISEVMNALLDAEDAEAENMEEVMNALLDAEQEAGEDVNVWEGAEEIFENLDLQQILVNPPEPAQVERMDVDPEPAQVERMDVDPEPAQVDRMHVDTTPAQIKYPVEVEADIGMGIFTNIYGGFGLRGL